jgi:hypothetical protein
VRSTLTPKLLVVTLAFVAGLATAGLAQTEPPAGQTPPAEQPKPPEPDRGTTSQINCIDQNTETTGNRGSFAIVTVLENKCEARIKCRLYIHAVHSKGDTLGRATLTLGRKSEGAAAKRTYVLKVPSAGGMTTSTRECRAY